MEIIIACLTIVAIALAAIAMVAAWRRKTDAHRTCVRLQAFPEPWQAMLEENVGIYKRLPKPLRNMLHQHILEFLDDKHFEGCAGIKISDEMRLTIAALACIPLLGRSGPIYPDLSSILIYPGAFVPPETRESDELFDDESELDGESWDIGAVILAWDSILQEAPRRFHPRNVILHEFAHQLARQEGFADGYDFLDTDSGPGKTLRQEFQHLQQRSRRGITGFIDDYAATNPAEFFAVLTELFFGNPTQLHLRHPRIYEAFRTFYRVHPMEWEKP